MVVSHRLQFYCLIVILISVAVTTNGVAVVRLEAAPKPSVRVVSAQTAQLPEPWTDVELGGSGSSSFANDTFTVEGSGAGIKGKSDRFHFVCTPLKGDGQVVARVASIQSASPWAVAGVMIREDITPGARNVSFLVTPGNGLAFQSRRQVAGRTSSIVEGSISAPCWVKLERAGNTINGYYSKDGVDWALYESARIRLSKTVCVGLAVASHDTQLAATSTFDGVSVGPVPSNGISLTLNPKTVPGGSPSQGTVSLSVPAPATGVQVSLQSSDVPVGMVPSTVLILPQALSATFTVTTNHVSTSTTVNISADYSGLTSAATLTVTAPQPPPPGVDLASLVLNPTTVAGGNLSQGTVTLTGAAPSDGILITMLSKNTSAATVPAAVAVPAGAVSAAFTVSSSAISSTAVVMISASYASTTKTATLTVTPPPPPAPDLLSLTLNPTSVVGGSATQGTINLTGAAPASGLAVTLSSNTAVATVPSSVTVAPGTTRATFTVATSTVSSTTSVTITASRGGTIRTATLAVNPTSPAGVGDYYVSPSGSDSNPGTESLPFQTIQKAAAVVNPGETVIVEDGTYTASGAAIVTLSRGGSVGKPVTFKSRNKWGAKLDGRSNTNTAGVKFQANYIHWEGFEIFGVGNAGGSSTGLELYGYGKHSALVGNRIHDIGRVCTSTSNGQTGILLSNGTTDVLVEGNVIHDIGRFAPGEQECSVAWGYENHDHGLYLSYTGDVRVYNNVFYNHARGWAIHAYNSDGRVLSNVSILNNTFAFPNPYRDGHIIFSNRIVSNTTIQNNIFYQPNAAAVHTSNASFASTVISNNLAYGVSKVMSDGNQGATVKSNVFADPKFVSPSGFDFHLQSGSPAIDTGLIFAAITKDLDGAPRPLGASYDIGAFEFGSTTAPAQPTPPPVISSFTATPRGTRQLQKSGLPRHARSRTGRELRSLLKASLVPSLGPTKRLRQFNP